jgi:hypothetical protein
MDYRIPPDFLDHAIDRLTALGASATDRRDAVAILALVSAGLDPQSYATSRKSTELAERLGLDLTGWWRIIGMLERTGLLQRVRRGGKHQIALAPPGARLPGAPRRHMPPDSRLAESA